MIALKYLPLLVLPISATPIIFDGRVPFNVTNSDLDTSTGPFLTYAWTVFMVRSHIIDFMQPGLSKALQRMPLTRVFMY